MSQKSGRPLAEYQIISNKHLITMKQEMHKYQLFYKEGV